MSTSALQQRYQQLLADVHAHAHACARKASDITVVAVSKTAEPAAIRELYEAGCRDFGESRVQSLLPKIEALPSDIRWHFIGPLQANKINKILGHVYLIHSIDTPELACDVATRAKREGVCQSVLLQVNSSGEASKQGLAPLVWQPHIESVCALSGVAVHGVMTMAPHADDRATIADCFTQAAAFQKCVQAQYPTCAALSMGMSHDWREAIAAGATILRIGRSLFAS